jgi:nucleotide-binding universal stress UspA family protein
MKVLLGIDGSGPSFDALDEALARADAAGDDLTVAIVDRDAVELTPDEIEERVRGRLAESSRTPDVVHLEGHPGSRLVEMADSEGFDRLLIGGGERSALGKIQLDETIEFVLLNSETTVTLVR